MSANDKSTQDYFGHATILSDTHIYIFLYHVSTLLKSEHIHTLLPQSFDDVCEVCRKDGGNQGQINSYNPNMKASFTDSCELS